jgi:heme exporter protein A
VTAAVVARALEKRFGAVAALRGVDLELPEGGCLAVLGPNGAGKSTLLRIVAGLARPTAGEISIAGRPATDPVTRGRIGYVGHATLLYPTLTARENLIFAGRLQGLDDPDVRADALLAEEGLDGVATRAAGDFSRGMAQRLSIARARVHDPPVLLLDEPFTGLDRRAADRLAARIASLHADGRTLLLVTHDVARAAELADRAIVLARGAVSDRCVGALDRVALERAVANAEPVA